METTKSEREKVQNLLDSLENAGWLVQDFDADLDPYEPLAVSVNVEFQPPIDIGDDAATSGDSTDTLTDELLSIITDVEEIYAEGAPEDEVVATAIQDLDVEESVAKDAIEQLEQRGDIYEPCTDHYRST